MSVVQVDPKPTLEKLASLGITSWPIWSCEISEFPWTYDSRETCLLLEGEVVVTPDDGKNMRGRSHVSSLHGQTLHARHHSGMMQQKRL